MKSTVADNIIIENPLRDIFIWINNIFPKEKIVFGAGKKQIHYTVHLGRKSGVMDIHRTDEKSRKRKTVLSIKRTDLTSLSNSLANILPTYIFLLSIFKKKSLSEIVKHNWKAQPMFITPEYYSSIINLRKNKIKFSKTVSIKEINALLFSVKYIKKHRSNVYLIYNERNKPMGILVKGIITLKPNQYYYLSIHKFLYLLKESLVLVEILLNQLRIENKQNILKFISSFQKDL